VDSTRSWFDTLIGLTRACNIVVLDRGERDNVDHWLLYNQTLHYDN